MRRLGILAYLENVKGILGACEIVVVCRHVCSCCWPRRRLDGCWSRQWWTDGKVTESWAWKLHAAHAHLGVLHLQYWLAWTTNLSPTSCALECSTECKILIMLMRVSWDFVQTYRPLKLCNWWFRDRSSSSRRGDRFAVTNNFEDAVLQDGGGKHAVIGSWTKSSKTNRPIMSSRSAAYWLWNRLQFRCAIVTSFRAVGTSQLLSIIDLPKQGNQERRTRV
jgi:hypothetical protein